MLKSHTSAKMLMLRRIGSQQGSKALMGYLHLTKQTERMEELIRWCIRKLVKNG